MSAENTNKELEQQEENKRKLHIAWRRSKTLEYLADGMTHTAIAEKLQIADSTVHEDVTYLRTTAKERLKEHIEEQLPFAIQQCLIRLQKSLHEMVLLKEKHKDNAKIQLQATQVIDDIAVEIVDISAHIEPVNNLLSHIIKKTEKDVSNLKKQAAKKTNEHIKCSCSPSKIRCQQIRQRVDRCQYSHAHVNHKWSTLWSTF